MLNHRKDKFDKKEFKFGINLLQQKESYFYPDQQEIQDGEVVKYYEHQKKVKNFVTQIAYSNIHRENKLRKRRLTDKQEEQEKQQKVKQAQMIKEAEIVSKKKIHRDRILNLMYRNPEVFKVNTIVQTIERLKRGSSDPDEGDADGDHVNQPVVLSKLSQTKPYSEAKCKEVAMETISRTVDVIKPSYPGSIVRAHSHRQLTDRSAIKQSLIPEGLNSKVNLAESTKGLHFQKVRSRKVMGGIFAVIKLKKQIDEFERLQSKNQASFAN